MNAAEVLLGPALARGLGDRPALIFEGRSVTYAELDARASRCGHALRDAGVKVQDRVMLLVHDRPEWFYAYLGAMKLGAVPVAINLRASAEELRYVIEDSACRVFVVDAAFLPLYETVATRLTSPPAVVVADRVAAGHRSLDWIMKGRPDALEPEDLAPEDMAIWMYTSGTTGKPKGTVHLQRAMPEAPRFLGEVLGVGPGDRLFCTSKLFFAFSLGHCVLASLQLGAATVLLEPWPTTDAVADVVERDRPTVVFTVPTLYRNLLRDGQAQRKAFRQVRQYISAGERLPEALFERWHEATGRRILEGVGATETLMMFLANRPDDCRPGASGLAAPGTEVRLTDEAGDPVVEAGRTGVMWVRSDCIAAGYWNQDEMTAAAFRDGWYCTGDMFSRDADGWYQHQGRLDDMLKVSGQWVSPTEIE
ncbi:MAG: AMP-binding protein, partial [Kiloniellales bacterium]